MSVRTVRPRRRLLVAAAGAVLAGGCAVRSGGAPRLGRVVVVGGGFGGATAARYLRLWGGEAVDVTLVEREARFVSCPMSNLVLGGFRRIEDITRDYAGLEASGVRVVQGEVVGIDAAARRVQLADGRALPYERLVLSPGVDFVPGAIEGLDADAARTRFLHAWKHPAQTAALRRQLESMADGGVFAISIPKAPYRCPPGPYERACLVAAYLKRTKPRSKVLVLDANPEVQSKQALFERAFREHYAGTLEYRPNSELLAVDAAAGVAKFEFEDVRADVMNVVPAQRAGEIARRAGLVNVNDRWAAVDWLSMESTALAGVHVLGDATFPAPAMPKSGHMASQQGKLAAAAILQLLGGQPVSATPVLMSTCYSFATPDEAMHVASVHQYDARERTFKAVPGAGGLSAMANRAEARLALAWAQNIWADMLALPPA